MRKIFFIVITTVIERCATAGRRGVDAAELMGGRIAPACPDRGDLAEIGQISEISEIVRR